LYFFFKVLKNHILGFYISLPIIVLILYMGFIRQGIAFSFLLLALANLNNKNFHFYYLFILLGIFFHKSLIFFLLFGLLVDKSKITRIAILTISLLVLIIFYKDFISLYNTYLGTLKGVYYDESRGSNIRLLMNLLPAIFILIFSKKFEVDVNYKKVYIFLSIIFIFMFVLKDFAITFVDRLNYYFVILQLYIFGNIQNFNFDNKYIKINLKFILIFYYIFIYLFWLLFANHNIGWLPYKNILFNA